MCTYTHVSIVRDLVDMRYKQYQHGQEHMQKYVLDEWTQMETDLTRERGLWGPPVGCSLDKWMLDPTEGMQQNLFHFILLSLNFITQNVS